MVGDDDVEPARRRLGDLGGGRDPAVDGQDEPAALVGEPRERLAADAVALVEAAREMPVDVGAELAQEEDGERGGGDAVDVVVAVDADPPPGGDRGADALARGLHVAEQERVVRRLLAVEEAPRVVGVDVAAPDEHGGRQLRRCRARARARPARQAGSRRVSRCRRASCSHATGRADGIGARLAGGQSTAIAAILARSRDAR